MVGKPCISCCRRQGASMGNVQSEDICPARRLLLEFMLRSNNTPFILKALSPDFAIAYPASRPNHNQADLAQLPPLHKPYLQHRTPSSKAGLAHRPRTTKYLTIYRCRDAVGLHRFSNGGRRGWCCTSTVWRGTASGLHVLV